MVYNALLSSLILQLCLATPGLAGPITLLGLSVVVKRLQYLCIAGFLGLIVLVLDILVIIEVIESTRSVISKLAWCTGVFLFPVGGIVAYYLFSDRSAYKRGCGCGTSESGS
ncbi:hypothetical protein VTK56DRAFT_4982 [Thermocarpiscus australiensis]